MKSVGLPVWGYLPVFTSEITFHSIINKEQNVNFVIRLSMIKLLAKMFSPCEKSIMLLEGVILFETNYRNIEETPVNVPE